MDGTTFDRFSRALATGLSRRRAVLAALGLGAAALAGVALDAGAAPARCRAGRATCSKNSQCCSGTCRTGRGIPLADRNRCTCEGGTVNCNGRCVDKKTDERNCGACGNVCRAGEFCIEGACVVAGPCVAATAGAGAPILCLEVDDGELIFIDPLAVEDACVIDGIEEGEGCALGAPCVVPDELDNPAYDELGVRAVCVVGGAGNGNPLSLPPGGVCLVYTAATCTPLA